MEKFKTLNSIPAILNISNVDTSRYDYSKTAFKNNKENWAWEKLIYELRFDENDKTGDFILIQNLIKIQ